MARTSILEAFTAGQGYLDDGAYGLRSWLLHQVRISKGPAAGDAADEILVAAARGGMDLHDLAALAAEMLAGAATSPQGHIWGVSRPVGRGQSGPVS